MADPRSAGLFSALRAAVRSEEERFLVGLADERDRNRIAAALGAEGTVLTAPSGQEALARLQEEPFDLVVLADGEAPGGKDWIAVAREVRPFADLVLVTEGDPLRAGEAFSREIAAVLPRPLPDSDALLRAHLRWLASGRRSRTRGLLLGNAVARFRDDLVACEPALADALSVLLTEAAAVPAILALGDAELVTAAGGRPGEMAPDALVLGTASSDNIERRLQEGRGRAAGRAMLIVDEAPTAARLSASLYGGARAYLPRAALPQVGRLSALLATRRRREVMGRRLIETLARFGVLDDHAATVPAPPSDVDARLIADATGSSARSTFVPSGHEVLVVDDEVVVLTVLREALRRGGYRVTTAASAEEAIELMGQRRFDLILTDKNLPGASGLDVLRASRKLDPAPAVVLITGYSSYDSAVEALEIGALDYIEKPIRDLENLRFRIRRALSRRDEQMARAPAPEGTERPRVLVVEVEGARRALIANFLGRIYDVTAAASGDEALDLLRQSRYDLVLADRNLPGMSGLRVIEQAQQLLPHCASVLYTAYPSYETVKEAFELGASAYVVRPSEDLKALAEKVAGALRSRGGILLG